MKPDTEYAVTPMPTNPYWDELQKFFRVLKKDPRYQFAKSCIHCTDGGDSFGRYHCTYCHQKQKIIADMSTDLLDECKLCTNYKRR